MGNVNNMLLIVELWRRQAGRYFCISTKSVSGKWKDHWFEKSALREDIEPFIKANLDKNLYFCPHGFTEKTRQKEYAVDPKMLYADLDQADPKKMDMKPTIALESSPGRYVGFWETDVKASEQLNRRLCYSVGADVSGWDRTQVLRIPNTRNYKYENTPRVKLLWNDGPTYEVERLEKLVPKLKSVMGDEINEEATQVFKRYEKKMPHWLRRELVNGKPHRGERSEVLWKLQNELLEIGMSREEAFSVLWACPWNKFKSRRDGVDQLWRELDKALEQHFSGYSKPVKGEDPLAFNPLPQSMANVVMRNINWIVPGMLARGEVTIIEGDPGRGKSYLTQIICGAICDGKPVPSETPYKPVQGRVAYFDTENSASTVTKNRLIENGVETLENYWQGEEPFSIDDEERWEAVDDALDDFRPTVIVFDTINLYIGGADTYRSSETNQALARFKQLASRFDCSVVLLRHLTKSTKEKALYRGQGSIAFTGVARIVLTVGSSPDDPEVRVVACTKNNIGPFIRSFTFRIDPLPDTPKLRNRSKFTWGEFVDLSADDVVNATPIKNKDKDNAMRWLKEQLEKTDRADVIRLERMASARSISKSVLHRTAEQLGVIKSSRGEGRGKQNFWALPVEEGPSNRESHGRRNLQKSTKRTITF